MMANQVRLLSDGEELVLGEPQGVAVFSQEIDPRERFVHRRALALSDINGPLTSNTTEMSLAAPRRKKA